jgi:hypothetical protein
MSTIPAEQSSAVEIAEQALEQIDRHARDDYPDECCGALLERAGRIVEAFRLPSSTAAGARRRFRIGPSDYRLAEARAAAIGGTLAGFSIRVPTINVSFVDLSFVAKKATSVDEVNKAAKQASEADLKGILEYSDAPLVSSDFNHNPASSVFDATLTKVSEGTLVKVCAWYDNEWGFSNRMLDCVAALMNAK